ncbi:FAD/NAD(P)-binding domain-containing protein [Dentipellis sp. KUC8613]|nr:FAD/NAD(P)-binding domain-containing protein [Dentipellis sp. KUC8613]
MSKNSRKSVVIVGGGGAGSAIARALSGKLDPSKHELTLITSRPFAVHLPAVVRLTTTSEGSLEDTVLIPYDKLLINDNGTIIVDTVTSIEDGKNGRGGDVILSSGRNIHYDILILSPGSHWSGPLDLPVGDKTEALAFIKQWREKFENAKGIVLAGGGAVGLEFAGEIKDYWPKKPVTIVHSQSQLLNDAYPDKFRKRAEQGVRSRGIELVFNDYIDDWNPSGAITTRKGKKLDGDLLLPTFGARPATEFIASLGSDVLTSQGNVKVLPSLQLRSYPNIFAAGDVIDVNEQKQLAKTAGHAGVIVANVLSILAGGSATKEYKGSPEIILVTNGKNRGYGYFGFLWGIVIGDFFARLLKSKGLMIGMVRQGYGQPA